MQQSSSFLRLFSPRLAVSRRQGFSLVELLIVLAVVGLAALFTIPKFFTQNQMSAQKKWNADAREVGQMLMSAMAQYRAKNGSVPLSLTSLDLEPYISYQSIQTTGSTDLFYSLGTIGCTTYRCYKMPSGGVLSTATDISLCDVMASGHAGEYTAVFFDYDPDGVPNASTNGTGKALRFYVYPDGSVREFDNLLGVTWLRGGSPGSTCTHWANIAVVPDWWEGY